MTFAERGHGHLTHKQALNMCLKQSILKQALLEFLALFPAAVEKKGASFPVSGNPICYHLS